MTKQVRELLFLKDTGGLIGEITSEMNRDALVLDRFLIKSVEIDEDAGEYWYGDYSTGEIRSRSDKPVITETYVKYTTNVTILTEYPIHKQLNILIDMLANSDIPKTSEFTAMKEFLDAARQNHADQLESYSSNPSAFTYISQAEEQEMIDKKQI